MPAIVAVAQLTLALTSPHVRPVGRSALSPPGTSQLWDLRRAFTRDAAVVATAAVAGLAGLPAPSGADTTTSGLVYSVVSKGKGPVPEVGELAVLRWTASCNGVVFDDLYKKNDFYYHRVGSGNLVPGVEEALSIMHTGDIWDLEIPGALGFGPKGKKATPGQPSIPPNATLKYRLELVALPGRDNELLEVTGGDPGVPES